MCDVVCCLGLATGVSPPVVHVFVARALTSAACASPRRGIAALIIPGIICTVTFGPHETSHVTGPMVIRHALRPNFLKFEIFMGCMALLGNHVANLAYSRPTKDSYAPNESFKAKHPLLASLRPVLFNFLGGLFGAHQVRNSRARDPLPSPPLPSGTGRACDLRMCLVGNASTAIL